MMDKEVRVGAKKYLRQTYGDFSAPLTPSSPLFSKLTSLLTSYLLSHYPNYYPNDSREIVIRDARDLVKEMYIDKERQNNGTSIVEGGSARGDVSRGWRDSNSRVISALRNTNKFGY